MTKYINANTLVQDIEVSRKNNQHNNAIASQTHNAEHRHFIKMVLDQPAADVAPVVHGEWITCCNKPRLTSTSAGASKFWFECSLCGRREIQKEPYCHCGAKMDGGNE